MPSRGKSCVVITEAEPMDYLNDYVALPKNYGSKTYFNRKDIMAIIKTVHENLTILDKKIHFTEKIKGEKVVIKPNLVAVYHDIGFKDKDYPESTDPRVLDAVISFLKKYTDTIVVAESSGRGFPTRGAFKVSGINRIAKYHNIKLMALEEQSVERFILPKAAIMKEIIVPQIFGEIARGEAFYISLPKMKTNLYTDVTLGFKNAMGTITYNLRQRNHNYCIDQKLVDMHYLFKPDLVIIDGIVGAEGFCPAPVDPVDSRVIVSGNNCVETDRVATRIMGHDPEKVQLIQLAGKMGFGDNNVEIIGENRTIPFRKANPSFTSNDFKEKFPNVKILIGHNKSHAPIVKDITNVTPKLVEEMEMTCRGGCLATLRFSFEMLFYEGIKVTKPLTVIIGAGAEINGDIFYFDSSGKPYAIDDIKNIKGKTICIGSCTGHVKTIADYYCSGCMPFPNAPHTLLHKAIRKRCRVMGLKNKNILLLLSGLIGMSNARKRLIKKGKWLDCELAFDDSVITTRELTDEEKNMDYISWPFPTMTEEDKKRLVKFETYMMLKSL